jgi:anti-sigma factor RsiW
MNCNEFRRQSVLAEQFESLPAPVRSHFAECPECKKYLEEQERLRSEVRTLAASEHGPQRLRESVAGLFRQSHARKHRHTRRWAAIAAGILLVLGIGTGYLSWYRHAQAPSPERLAQAFISDHLNYLPGREQITSGSAQEVEGWFQGRVEFPVHVPDLPGAALQDARVCDISGRKAALLHYRHNTGNALISVFVAEEPRSFDQQMKSRTLVASDRGLNSALWCHRGLVYDVVAPLDDAALHDIAESVRKQEP